MDNDGLAAFQLYNEFAQKSGGIGLRAIILDAHNQNIFTRLEKTSDIRFARGKPAASHGGLHAVNIQGHGIVAGNKCAGMYYRVMGGQSEAFAKPAKLRRRVKTLLAGHPPNPITRPQELVDFTNVGRLGEENTLGQRRRRNRQTLPRGIIPLPPTR